jgi:SRSO17 transposase
LDELVELISGRFSRVEPRRRVGSYLRGLLAGLERKNGWTLAEHAGAVSPDGMQRLLRTAGWDVDGVRDDVRGYVLQHLSDETGVFVVDDTGFVKKGVRSAGVARQYTGTTGKVDNCQIGVFLAYASSQGRALVDRELYLPTSWTEDRDRCTRAGVPDEVGFQTKPQLGIAMLARAHAADRLAGSWVTADEAYGQNPIFRAWLADRWVPFVLATRNDDVLVSPDGHRRQAKVLATIAGHGEGGGWERRSIGPGAHGEHEYDWTTVALDPTGLPQGWGHWLLIRRQTRPGEGKKYRDLAFYRCAGPAAPPCRS